MQVDTQLNHSVELATCTVQQCDFSEEKICQQPAALLLSRITYVSTVLTLPTATVIVPPIRHLPPPQFSFRNSSTSIQFLQLIGVCQATNVQDFTSPIPCDKPAVITHSGLVDDNTLSAATWSNEPDVEIYSFGFTASRSFDL